MNRIAEDIVVAQNGLGWRSLYQRGCKGGGNLHHDLPHASQLHSFIADRVSRRRMLTGVHSHSKKETP